MIKFHRSTRIAAAMACVLAASGAASDTTETTDAQTALDGRTIIARVDDANDSADGRRQATMLIERGKQKLVRRLAMQNKRYGDDERSLIRFLEPADVRNTQFLSWTYDEVARNDDLWVFFPTENLIRRISGGGKRGSFMRSDFANEDIERRSVDDDTHDYIETVQLGDRPAYVVESRPVPAKAQDSAYAMRRSWIDTERWIALQVEYYDRRDRLMKRLSQGGIEEIDGIWTATKLIMETPRRKSRTLMQYSEVAYNVGLEDAVFEQATLGR
ncbi:MAG: outer membrane lipoprotein-sorting protein [Pseudomonadota bacterium]